MREKMKFGLNPRKLVRFFSGKYEVEGRSATMSLHSHFAT